MMAQRTVSRVTCPACGSQFQAPVEQILDTQEDPSAKRRVINGVVNVGECPHCGTRSAFNLPFLYHDREKELALVYMPMEVGRDDADRQKIIGNLTSQVMDSLPPEDRKGYLLQPQVFLTMENIRKKILKEDGVTEEMIEEQEAKAELLRRMLDATSEEALEAMIRENDEQIDDVFFYMVSQNLQMAQASGAEQAVHALASLHETLIEVSSEGQAIQARNEKLEELREEPEREKLLELLIEASDEDTRDMLITYGRPLVDYLFFQQLTAKIEAASAEEKERLTALRKEILDVKERLDQETEQLFQARAELLRDLLLSDNPEELARRRFMEIDEAFLNILTTNIQMAEEEGEEEAAQALRRIWNIIVELVGESLPAEMIFFRQLMSAEDEEQVEQILEANSDLVTPPLIDAVEEMVEDAHEEDRPEAAERFSLVLEKMKAMV